MKIETQLLDDHKAKVIVQTEADAFEAAKKRAARKISQRTKIPGFRPGKAPYAMVLRHLGEASILEEAIELHVQDIYPAVLKQAEIEPYAPGELENIINEDPPTFEFVIPLKPIVKLGDYQNIREHYEQNKISDDDINRVIDDLREQQAIFEPANRPIIIGDVVTIKIVGKKTDQITEVTDETNNLLISEKSISVLIQDTSDNLEERWPFMGFSHHLIGMSHLEKRIIKHKFEDDFYVSSLRGIEAEYDVTIEEVKSRTLPEITDEFAQSIGDYSDLAGLINSIRTELERNETETYNNSYDETIIKNLIEISEIKYPPEMIEREMENVRASLIERLSRQNMDVELYLKYRGITQDDLNNELLPVAENQLKTSLVLIELSRKEKIKVDEKALQAETSKSLHELTPFIKQKKRSATSEREMMTNLISNIAANIMMRQTIERLRSIARGEMDLVETIPNNLNSDIENQSEAINQDIDQ